MFIFWIWLLLTSSLSWASCPTDEICEPQFKKCYKFMEEEKDFFSAEEECQFQGGHLVSFMNAFEKGMVEDVAESMFVGSSDYWIGANKFTSDSWSWTDGSKWGYTSWFPGQPSSGSVASAELGIGMWMTSTGISHKPFICGLPYNGKNTTVSTTPIPTPAPRALCEDGWVHFGAMNSCYKIILKQSFPAAEKQCNSLGAHLASVHSKAENDFIAGFAMTGLSVGWSGQPWLGLYKISGIWYWTDSTPVDYTNWASREPNNNLGIENCAELAADDLNFNITESYKWKWNDSQCDLVFRAAVCKKSEL